MYKNYGDINFFEYGVLVEEEKKDEIYNVILCRPYFDDDNVFQYGQVTIDITENWLDKNQIMDYIGITENNFNPIQFAIGCTEYYNLVNFGLYKSDYTKEEIKEDLRNYEISSDNFIPNEFAKSIHTFKSFIAFSASFMCADENTIS